MADYYVWTDHLWPVGIQSYEDKVYEKLLAKDLSLSYYNISFENILFNG